MDVKLRLLAAALVGLTVHASPAGAAPGDLDASFSNDGRVSTLTSPDTFVPRAVAVQPDGRIVVAGYSCDMGTCGLTGNSSFRLVRYTADGGLDTDFGAGGMVTTPIGPGRAQAFDVLVRPDGRIIAGGVASASDLDRGSFALAGYTPAGRVDRDFGAGGSGQVVMPVGDGFDAISDLVAGRGDRVIAVGQAQVLGHDRIALARFDGRGVPDSSFDGNGSLIVPASAPHAYAAGGTLLPDGRVVAVGASGRSSAVQDLRLSGVQVDDGGGAGPLWLRPVGASYSFANAAVALPDGRVLAAGVATDRGRFPGMALTRTSPEGVPDASFDGDGAALVRARDGSVAADVVLEPGGRAVAAGDSTRSADHSFMLARLDGAGALDRGFGDRGVVLTAFPGATIARATALALQADGKLVAAGIACVAGSGAQCGGGTARLALARYLGGDAAAALPGPGTGAPPAGGPAGTAPFASLPSRLRARHGRVRIRVQCRQARRCRGRLSLWRLRTRRRSLLLGARTVAIRGHRARTFTVKLRRKRLGTRRRLRVRIEFAGRDATGAKRRVTRSATLRRG